MISGIATSASKKSESLMSRRQVLLQPPPSSSPTPWTSPSPSKQRPLVHHSRTSSSSSCCSGGFAEVAGGTTAECAAVCCCCPCGLMNFLILAVYKLPAGLFRRVLRKKRRRQQAKKGLLPPQTPPSRATRRCTCGCDGTEIQIHPTFGLRDALDFSEEDGDEDDGEDIKRLENEMWERFYGTGFWRSPSQRESPINNKSTS